MNPKLKTFLFFLFGALAGIAVMYLINPSKRSQKDIKKVQSEAKSPDRKTSKDKNGIYAVSKEDNKDLKKAKKRSYDVDNQSIDELTKESVVIDFLKKHQKLPNYYISKKDAREHGWEPGKGNLCDVLPGKAIGGDKFSNREKKLPVRNGRQYYEADLNYSCRNRNADRIVFSNDGLIFITHDHYQTFEQQ